MRRILILGVGLAVGAGVAAGCGDELPTAVGAELIAEGFRTFEVVLDAEDFLARDTTYDRLGSLNTVPFALVAEAFERELFAHTLFRITIPRRVTYENEEGTSITDSVFTVVGGTVTLVFDSLTDSTTPIELEVLDVTESWHAPSVTWEQRFDTAGVSEAWAEPGGTTGQLLGSATWESGDTMRIPLDSASAAVWTDSAAAFHGGLIRSATPGTRVRIQAVDFEFDVRPESTDTIVGAGSAGVEVIVATPEASTPDGTELRVGGVPTWRSALKFQPLQDVQIPCSPGNTTCTVPLSEVEVSLAALLLHPVPVGMRRIERPIGVEGRAVLRAPGVPVNRSPLSPAFGRTRDPLIPDAFTAAPAEPGPAAVPMTTYVRRNLDPVGEEDPILWVGLVAQAEQQAPVFGYAAFGSIQSAAPPQLRLVVTVPAGEELK